MIRAYRLPKKTDGRSFEVTRCNSRYAILARCKNCVKFNANANVALRNVVPRDKRRRPFRIRHAAKQEIGRSLTDDKRSSRESRLTSENMLKICFPPSRPRQVSYVNPPSYITERARRTFVRRLEDSSARVRCLLNDEEQKRIPLLRCLRCA
jgi:hypothetical protein